MRYGCSDIGRRIWSRVYHNTYVALGREWVPRSDRTADRDIGGYLGRLPGAGARAELRTRTESMRESRPCSRRDLNSIVARGDPPQITLTPG